MLVDDPKIFFAAGAQWKQNLATFCQQRIPNSMELSHVQVRFLYIFIVKDNNI